MRLKIWLMSCVALTGLLAASPAHAVECMAGDSNHDGVVNVLDITIVPGLYFGLADIHACLRCGGCELRW